MKGDIFLDYTGLKRLVGVLKGVRFEDFEVHPHYFKDGNPRHGISLGKTKEVYCQFDKIIAVFMRPGLVSPKYSFIYRISKKESYILVFFLDEKPRKFFNIIPKGAYIDSRLFRKNYGFSR
ncbi:MAG: hypothetical protein V1645_03675 [archaeon]